MLPLRDENPTRHTPYLTWALIGLNVAAFLFWEPISQSQFVQTRFFYCNALVPYEVVNQTNLVDAGSAAGGQALGIVRELGLAQACPDKSWLLSVFVSMFLHGGWLHIAGNMLFLWVFGNNVEDKVGHIPYLFFYLGAGVVATIAQVGLFHTGQSAFVPNLGASGAVAGVLGAYMFMFPRRRVLTLLMFFFITTVYLPAFVVLGLWFVLQFFNGVAALSPALQSGGGVAFWAHIGGFAFGALLAMLFFPRERFGSQAPPRRPDAWGMRRGGGLWQRRLPPYQDYPY